MSDTELRRIEVCADLAEAEVVSAHLHRIGIPARIESRPLETSVGWKHFVVIPAHQYRRAQLALAQLPLSDAVLKFLASGELPNSEADSP